jgi:hypothetical protein
MSASFFWGWVATVVTSVWASPVPRGVPTIGFDHVPCKDSIASLLESWDSRDVWRRMVAPGKDAYSFSSPTGKLGVWVELHSEGDGQVRAVRMAEDTAMEMTWDTSNCHPQLTTQKFERPRSGSFSDEELRKLVNGGKAGVIYAWTPGMVYSMDAYADLKKVTSKLGLKLTLVMDPSADPASARKMSRAQGFPLSGNDRRMESVELLARGMNIHYPTLVVYADGKLADSEVVGAWPAQRFEERIQAELAQIRRR